MNRPPDSPRTESQRSRAIVLVAVVLAAGLSIALGWEFYSTRYWSSTAGSTTGTGPRGGDPSAPFVITAVFLDFDYGGQANGYLGESGQNVCGVSCPASWSTQGGNSCAMDIALGLGVTIVNGGSMPHSITRLALQGGGGSAESGQYWSGFFENSVAQSMQLPYTIAPGQTSPYGVLELAFGGSCGPIPAGSFSITVTLSTN